MTVPAQPKIYHITHIDNLPKLIEAGKLWSDAKRVELGLDCEIVGMSTIKKRRLEELEVKCHPGTKVGEYAPFYFCPRSIMLYILYRGNHPELDYNQGQAPIIHLQADVRKVVAWADEKGRRWAFSDSNAGAYYTGFYNDLKKLTKVNWDAVDATDFRGAVTKDGKQAEFLLHKSFPWKLVEKIGVIDATTAKQVADVLKTASYKPQVCVERGWYY